MQFYLMNLLEQIEIIDFHICSVLIVIVFSKFLFKVDSSDKFEKDQKQIGCIVLKSFTRTIYIHHP